MKLVKYGPFKRLGALTRNGRIVDLNLAYAQLLESKGKVRPQEHANIECPSDLQAFIEEGDNALVAGRDALSFAEGNNELSMPAEGVKLWAPLASTSAKICCAGGNMADLLADSAARREGHTMAQADLDKVWQNFKEGKQTMWGFWKLAVEGVGPDDDVSHPTSRTKNLEWEAELAAVVGKRGKNLPNDESNLDYIFGYTGFNDWSARGLDFNSLPPGTLKAPPGWTGGGGFGAGPVGGNAGAAPAPTGPRDSWMLGKNFDNAFSMGPYLLTKDEVPDPYDVKLDLWKNGEHRQDSNTKYMMYRFPAFMSLLSNSMTINPGDVFTTGSGGGSHQVSSELLKVGDVVKFTVGNCGTMQNRIVAEQKAATRVSAPPQVTTR